MTCTASVDKTEEKMRDEGFGFLSSLIKVGHESVLEHIVLSYEIEGVSRALLQEMARHRLVSLSVESTRWSLGKLLKREALEGKLCLPPSLARNSEIQDKLIDLLGLVSEEQNKNGSDVAKYLLPECWPTRFIVTMNFREFRHIYKLRSSSRALPEFRELVEKMKNVLPATHKALVVFSADKLIG